MAIEKEHFIYIVECGDGTFYTGYTTDVERRIKEHNKGEGAKYTRGRLPVKLRYQEQYTTKSRAMQRECEIKNLTREKKKELVK